MGKADWLEKIAENHDEWVRIVKSFGETEYHEDLVQEMYLVLYKYADESKIIQNNEVSRGYIFYTLRTCFLAYCKSKSKIQKIRIDEKNNFTQIQYIDEMDEQINYHKITQLIDSHIENWRWYDRQLYKLYRDTDMSIRKIASETNISWVSIFNTLKKCKLELKEKFESAYINYKNKDYEKI